MRVLTIIVALDKPHPAWRLELRRQGPYCLQDRESTNCGYPTFQACVVLPQAAPAAIAIRIPNMSRTGVHRAATAAEQVVVARS